MLVQEEKLRRAEDRIAQLEGQIARLQEQIAMITQERDDAVQMAGRSQAEARTLRETLSHAPAAAGPLPPALAPAPSTQPPAPTGAPPAAAPAAPMASAPAAAGAAAGASPAAAAPPPLQVIQRIRRDRGYDLDIPTEQMSACLSTLYASLDSALQKLAVDIYSSDSRFVLELIQNADDNTYGPSVPPVFRLKVTADQHAILTDNNEVGFSARNVESLCSIGGSTKTDAAHYIGRKGIGFKSVFKVRAATCVARKRRALRLLCSAFRATLTRDRRCQVTDEPHIFSGGFWFRFDARRPLGYIVPDWLPPEAWPAPVRAALAARPGTAPGDSVPGTAVPGTVMYLPLRQDVRLLQDDLAADLRGASQTILFLRRCVGVQRRVAAAGWRSRDAARGTPPVHVFWHRLRTLEIEYPEPVKSATAADAAVRMVRIVTTLLTERGHGNREQTLEIRTFWDGVEQLPVQRPSFVVFRRTLAVPAIYQPQAVASSLTGTKSSFTSTEIMLAFPTSWNGRAALSGGAALAAAAH